MAGGSVHGGDVGDGLRSFHQAGQGLTVGQGRLPPRSPRGPLAGRRALDRASAVTSCPRARSLSTSRLPVYPVPPVTATRKRAV